MRPTQALDTAVSDNRDMSYEAPEDKMRDG